jgi:hypothetical protein
MKRTYHLSEKAVARLKKIAEETGLKHSTIIERMILGKTVGEKP